MRSDPLSCSFWGIVFFFFSCLKLQFRVLFSYIHLTQYKGQYRGFIRLSVFKSTEKKLKNRNLQLYRTLTRTKYITVVTKDQREDVSKSPRNQDTRFRLLTPRCPYSGVDYFTSILILVFLAFVTGDSFCILQNKLINFRTFK